ncbi:hypothetical protein BJ912DRAFT_967237 [Pholiota molesta]|nr:hypothetical protein BJ912DRAFT_967237 [Pholiota molesta]
MHGPLSLDDSISIEESRRLINEAIAQHEASILALKSQKNNLAPISRFPPEILCRIFSFVKKETQGISGEWTRYRLRWIVVTHVSSHWRRVAIDSPSLWIDPPLRSIRWVQEMLKRSKDAGLVIEADLGSLALRAIIPGLKLALAHSLRIKHLSFLNISDTSISALNDLQKEFLKSAPQLEHLCIMVDESEDDPIVIAEEAFCQTPRLRKLELSQCNPNWNSHPHLFRSLTSLTLRHLTLDAKPTGKQFMDALKGMPDLEFLEIVDAFPVDQNWDSEQIHLASLQTLSIYSIHTEIETFLRCITFPPTAKVKIACSVVVDGASTSHTNVTEVILNLSRSYSNPLSDVAFRTLALLESSTFGYFGVRLELLTDAVDRRRPEYRFVPASLDLEFVWKTELAGTADSEHYVPKLISDIFGAIPLQDVAMHINFAWMGNHLCPETIASTFGILPQLRTVQVDRHTSGRFLSALKLGSSTQQARGTDLKEKLYFPNLSSIYFSGTEFWKSGQADVVQDPISISFESLKDWLVQRSESGARIEKVSFQSCQELRKSDIESLSQIVGKVDWDNIEIHSVAMSDYTYDSEDAESEEEYYEQEEIYYDDEMAEQAEEYYERELIYGDEEMEEDEEDEQFEDDEDSDDY